MELCLGLWVVKYQKEVDVCLYVPRGRVPTPGGDLVGVETSLPETAWVPRPASTLVLLHD